MLLENVYTDHRKHSLPFACKTHLIVSQQRDEGVVGFDDNAGENCFCVFVKKDLSPWGCRMIERLPLQSDTLECTNTHTRVQIPRHAWMPSEACCSGLSADGCLLGLWALWGPLETSRKKRSTGLHFVLQSFFHQLSTRCTR